MGMAVAVGTIVAVAVAVAAVVAVDSVVAVGLGSGVGVSMVGRASVGAATTAAGVAERAGVASMVVTVRESATAPTDARVSGARARRAARVACVDPHTSASAAITATPAVTGVRPGRRSVTLSERPSPHACPPHTRHASSGGSSGHRLEVVEVQQPAAVFAVAASQTRGRKDGVTAAGAARLRAVSLGTR